MGPTQRQEQPGAVAALPCIILDRSVLLPTSVARFRIGKEASARCATRVHEGTGPGCRHRALLSLLMFIRLQRMLAPAATRPPEGGST